MKLRRLSLPRWLTFCLVLVFIVRIPSLLEPFYYGDEMIYLSLGEGIRKGLVLYKQVHDNKPPLLYFLAAIAGNVFWLRAILSMWSIVTIMVFWRLCKALFKVPQTTVAATLLFAFLINLPLFEGFVANAELFMILPTILALLCVVSRDTYRSAFFAGIFLSIASLFKIPSIFDIGVVIAMWLFTLKFKRIPIKQFTIKTGTFFLGLSIPILISFVWYALRGAFNEYFVAAFLQNFGYVNSWRPTTTEVSFLTKNGPLLMRGLFAGIAVILLYLSRKKRSKAFLIASVWLITSLFAATLSERPYPHYFVQVIPSLAMLLGLLVTDETIEQVLVIFPISLFLFAAVYFNFWQYATSIYLGRFITLMSKGQQSYFEEFSPGLARNYETAKVIATYTNSADQVFVWGDSAGIYALSKRLPPIKYVADYHIRDFSSEEETYQVLEQRIPKIIVFLSEAPPFPKLEQFVRSKYIPLESPSGSTIWYNTSQ